VIDVGLLNSYDQGPEVPVVPATVEPTLAPINTNQFK
jgi:hypothetical protein